jgi:hypothetical protein
MTGPFTVTLDNKQYGSAETLIGNAICWHRPTRWTTFTAWAHRKRTGTGGRLKCRECKHIVQPGWGFWYHQAQAVINSLRNNQECLK